MAKQNKTRESMTRVDDVSVEITNQHDVPTTLFAREDVLIEDEGVEQALDFLGIQETVAELYQRQQAGQIPTYFGEEPSLERVVLTPDFHRGSGIPVGTVARTSGFIIPQAVGNDICCGMRLLVTSLTREDLDAHQDELMVRLREIFFEGRREIPMSPRQREALLRDGLFGLNEVSAENNHLGTWREYDPDEQLEALERVHFSGSLSADETFAFADYIVASGRSDGHDSQIGSIGGGNHFVELQVIEDVLDHHAAHAWGLRPGQVTIMIHSGSVGFGHKVGRHFLDRLIALWPEGSKHPEHGFYPMPTSGPHEGVYKAYLDAMRNAANFAFANRLFLGLMATRALREVTGKDPEASLIYDVPHNLIWEERVGDRVVHTHRKGACPAYGPSPDGHGPFAYTGQPVIIPGSMGDDSYLMAGTGAEHALSSACHGAGRKLSRGAARKLGQEETAASMGKLRVVGPVDLNSQALRQRPDIRTKAFDRLKEEGPHSYKPITPVIDTITDARIARKVARMNPWLTIKG